MDIKENLPFHDDKPATLVLSQSDKHQTIAIGLRKGQVLKKHMSATPAMIVVLTGGISVELEGVTKVIKELNTLQVPPALPHEVTGMEDSIFLLIRDKV
jgi:quercetin dioxygenase-like cupin family protein